MKSKKIVFVLITLFIMFSLVACGSSSSSNSNSNTNSSSTSISITDAHMATDVDSQGKPVDTVASYKTNSAKFTVSAILRNAPNNTKITFIWFYKGSKITTAEVDSGNIADRYIYGYLTNTQAWPTGEYSVEIHINNNTNPASVVNFTVK